jgi:hypothetical protein
MIGSNNIICENGLYPSLPECIASNCTETPNVANALSSWDCSGTISGSRCNLLCEDGYTASDGPLCFAGSFVDTATCNPDPCQPGSIVIENSRTGLGRCAGTPSGEMCAITCSEGYQPDGDAECHAGNFTNVPTCVELPCSTVDLIVTNSSSKSCDSDSTLLHGETCNVQCSSGFATEMTHYSTSFNARCDRGNWVDVMTCDDIDECDQANQPCDNGATCNDMIDHYTCSCSPNHYGVHCADTHNDCSGDIFELCGYGNCTELNRTEHNISNYQCACHAGWKKQEDRFHLEPCDVEIKCDPYVVVSLTYSFFFFFFNFYSSQIS